MRAGSLGKAPNRTQFTDLETETLFKDIEVLHTTSSTATGISMLHMYSQIAVQSHVCALAALLLLKSHNTTPPRDLEEVSFVRAGTALSKPAQTFAREKTLPWTLTCAGFVKHNSVRKQQTGIECRVYLSSTPHSHAVFDFATENNLAEAAEASPG